MSSPSGTAPRDRSTESTASTASTASAASAPSAPSAESPASGPTGPVPRLGLADTARLAARVLAPTVAQGAIARRPRVVGLAERLDLDARAVATVQDLHRRYGDGPVRLPLPVRRFAFVLSPRDVHRVLGESPEPFALANREKQGALGQFQPHGVLVSHGRERAQRRAVNESVLDTPNPVHRLAGDVVARVREEARGVAEEAARSGHLDWATYSTGWRRAFRRVVLGDAARDDEDLQGDLDALRYRANWSYLLPRSRTRRDRVRRRLEQYLERAEPGSLAGLLAQTVGGDSLVDPVDQIPQWLFAFDPAGMAGIRALALLAADADELARVRGEMPADLDTPQELRRLRAAVLESVRLWPTTPMILRETTRDVAWPTGRLAADTAVLVYAPFFHRDDEALAVAHRFTPELWTGEGHDGTAGDAATDWPLVPFSEGPGVCPGQNLVLLTTSTFLATLLEHHDHALEHPASLDPDRVPGVVSPFRVRFRTSPR
ncbi:cytochrome P450 [Actinomycetospora straminea]|uniref:Cytochrome P450 n=1 Tax=Actinomycetospora straminea TaxID=663607 RepID=A0ABP9F4S2_9PSEU|nr:cytochrome P450 [Actinomycetospora straminea]MDD7933662.1 cytochrome P450 [Actinomycetospora straminea]